MSLNSYTLLQNNQAFQNPIAGRLDALVSANNAAAELLVTLVAELLQPPDLTAARTALLAELQGDVSTMLAATRTQTNYFSGVSLAAPDSRISHVKLASVLVAALSATRMLKELNGPDVTVTTTLDTIMGSVRGSLNAMLDATLTELNSISNASTVEELNSSLSTLTTLTSQINAQKLLEVNALVTLLANLVVYGTAELYVHLYQNTDLAPFLSGIITPAFQEALTEEGAN